TAGLAARPAFGGASMRSCTGWFDSVRAYARGMRRIPAIAVLVAALLGTHLLFARTHMTPTVPGTRGDPQWQGVLRHRDGRTFVTDGGLAIDAALARPATLPQKEYPSCAASFRRARCAFA